MNPGVMVAIHAATTAAAAAKAKTEALDAFRLRGATAPERACRLPELGLAADNHALNELIQTGVIRGVDSRNRLTVLGDSVDRVAGYYLDEAAYIAHRDGKNKTTRKESVWIAVILLLALAGVALLLFVMLSRR